MKSGSSLIPQELWSRDLAIEIRGRGFVSPGPPPQPGSQRLQATRCQGVEAAAPGQTASAPQKFSGAGGRTETQAPRAAGRTHPLTRKRRSQGVWAGHQNICQNGLKVQRLSESLSGDADAKGLKGSRRFRSIRCQDQTMT